MSRLKQVQAKIIEQYTALRQALADAEHWHNEYLKDLEQKHNQKLATIEAELEQKIAEAEQKRTTVIRDVIKRINDAKQGLGILTEPWSSPLWNEYRPKPRAERQERIHEITGVSYQTSGYGSVREFPRDVRIGDILTGRSEPELKIIPCVIPLIGHKHILIISHGAAKQHALSLLQSIVLRVAVTFPPEAAIFRFIDPIGLGQNFPFKRLPERLRQPSVFKEVDEIRTQLRVLKDELARRNERYLARDYSDIEEYNRAGDEVVEPYNLLCIADFPTGFDTDSGQRLLSIAEQGVRTGIYLLAHMNADTPMIRDFDLAAFKRHATIIDASEKGFKVTHGGREFKFTPDETPSSQLFNGLLDRVAEVVGEDTGNVIPYERFIPPLDQWWSHSAVDGIETPIGRIGALEDMMFVLGQAEKRHVLIGGLNGSGKTNLFHILINGIALNYSPDEVELYLIDFKEGVAFYPYATYRLPHARVVAIETEPEFGVSIFKQLVAELENRSRIFKQASDEIGVAIQDYATYRKKTGRKLPRLVLIMDEFQKQFEENNSLTARASNMLEDLARRCGAFGIHLVMGSQSVAISNLSQNIYGQFETRIGFKSSERDFAALMSADNVNAVKALEKIGEVIYNNRGGISDGNSKGRVAWLRDEARTALLKKLSERAGSDHNKTLTVFRGDIPSSVGENGQLRTLYDLDHWPAPRQVKELFQLKDWVTTERPAMLYLGESAELKPATAAIFRRRDRSNLLIVASDAEIAFGMLGAACLSIPAFYRPSDVEIAIIDCADEGEYWENTFSDFKDAFDQYPIDVRGRRKAKAMLTQIQAKLDERDQLVAADREGEIPTTFLILSGIQSIDDLRPVPSKYGGRNEPSETAKTLVEILQRGPKLGIYTIIWSRSVDDFDARLEKQSLSLFDRRAGMHLSTEDLLYLFREPVSRGRQAFSGTLLDDERGHFEKFRAYALPKNPEERVDLYRQYAEKLRMRQS